MPPKAIPEILTCPVCRGHFYRRWQKQIYCGLPCHHKANQQRDAARKGVTVAQMRADNWQKYKTRPYHAPTGNPVPESLKPHPNARKKKP
ncbi:MAG: hypothetical protein ACREUV_10775, partial [Burkholderiales bacterium]